MDVGGGGTLSLQVPVLKRLLLLLPRWSLDRTPLYQGPTYMSQTTTRSPERAYSIIKSKFDSKNSTFPDLIILILNFYW